MACKSKISRGALTYVNKSEVDHGYGAGSGYGSVIGSGERSGFGEGDLYGSTAHSIDEYEILGTGWGHGEHFGYCSGNGQGYGDGGGYIEGDEYEQAKDI